MGTVVEGSSEEAGMEAVLAEAHKAADEQMGHIGQIGQTWSGASTTESFPILLLWDDISVVSVEKVPTEL